MIPFTRDDLTKAFQKLTLKYHPDIGGSHEVMKKVNEDREFLTAWATSPEAKSENDPRPLTTDTGKYLSDLGRGVGAQGVTCLDCEGQGYQSYTASVRVGIGIGCEHICPDCNGSGNFTLRSGRVVECRRCRHHGILPEWYCPKCSSIGYFYTYKDEQRYKVCSECSGVGEITIFNPVLQRGSLVL